MSLRTLIKQIVISILSFEARLVIKKHRPRIIAVTGSVGKTSVKDALYDIMKESYTVRKNKKSFNSEFGVPLTILDLPTGWNSPRAWMLTLYRGALRVISRAPYPAWLILEVGADHPGDIARSLAGISLDIAILTRVGDIPVHVEFFPSVDAVLHEKASLLDALRLEGTAILNGDDTRIAPLAKTLSNKTVILYGTHPENTVCAENIHIVYENNIPSGLAFSLITKDDMYPVTLSHTIGAHHAYTALAAFAAGVSAGISPQDAAMRLSHISPTPGRLHLLEGIRNICLIDDTYNASPLAVAAGLSTLRDITSAGIKVAILGDMRELGDMTESAHKDAGKDAAISADILIFVGDNAKLFAQGAQEAGVDHAHMHIFADAQEATTQLSNLIPDGATVFVKGSQGVRMERIVKALLAHPKQASHLLVRQEEEWAKR
ncbi:MAG: UDP-N-acetylmuramoyl-tripeptide--D-alanyl-D-alanine ligase [Candidatus Yonathbacteria bacterium]|nr:UDP-N-acetylmuramoyl-tripeptide--D-alanyl-D-alanine ligase [Candidatus Yonathbacteria bacterium]NTW48087.1 UDP-N-acetylmuramoyl-tripeptide--D-alanyl-D-alanine ligase [Candidatus Yonathbacteria bacterium]